MKTAAIINASRISADMALAFTRVGWQVAVIEISSERLRLAARGLRRALIG